MQLLGHLSFIFSLLMICWQLHAQEPVTLGGGSNFANITITTSDGNSTTTSGNNTVNGTGLQPNYNSASRFLTQATLGVDYETITALSGTSYSDWIDAQLAMPVSFKLLDEIDALHQMALDSMSFYGTDPLDFELGDKHFYFAWTKYAIEAPDILRSRVALALSEIFIISEDPDLDDYPRLLCDYYDMLLKNAFGNYRTLIEDVTYHPGMGVYLTHLNNPKTDLANNIFPDENYAREIMQLFSIGLFEMNLDGSPILDTQGKEIETYDDYTITELSKVFTGLSWGDAPFFDINNPISEDSWTQPMIMFDDEHESGTKTLLNGFVVPDRDPVDGNADISDALDNIFNHSNVGPFLALRLIQRLVKSNPSPDYIARIASVFNDNGMGVRGDLGAMVKAILLDQEARDCNAVDDPYAGMLREPMIRHTQLCRAFNVYVENGSGIYRDDKDRMKEYLEQRPLSPPSVFNFFLPDYTPIGDVQQAGLVAPEFQITDSRTVITYGTELNRWLDDDDDLFEYNSLFTDEVYDTSKEAYLNLTDELAMANNNDVQNMIERLNLILAAGQLSDETRATITDIILQVPENQPQARVRMAIFLIMYSPDYLIFK